MWLAIGFLIGLPLAAVMVPLGFWIDRQSPRTAWLCIGSLTAFYALAFLSVPLWVHSGRIGF